MPRKPKIKKNCEHKKVKINCVICNNCEHGKVKKWTWKSKKKLCYL